MTQLWISQIVPREGALENPSFLRQLAQLDGAHRLVWTFFSGASSPARSAHPQRDFLYRQEGEGLDTRFLVLSKSEPHVDRASWISHSKPFAPKLSAGQKLSFVARVNPVRRTNEPGSARQGAQSAKVKPGHAGAMGVRNDRKHDVVMLARHKLESGEARKALDMRKLVQDETLSWMTPHAQRSGFKLTEQVVHDGEREPVFRADGYRQHEIFRRGKPKMFISTVEVEGILEVVDPGLMWKQLWAGSDDGTIQPGLGSARGFGNGLLLVKPVR